MTPWGEDRGIEGVEGDEANFFFEKTRKK